MTKKIDRRTVIQIGAGSVVATAVGGLFLHEAAAKASLLPGPILTPIDLATPTSTLLTPTPADPLEYALLLDPGSTSQIDLSTNTLSSSSVNTMTIPPISSSALVTPSMADLEAWVETQSCSCMSAPTVVDSTASLLDAIMKTSVTGLLDLSTYTTAFDTNASNLDFSLDCFYRSFYETKSLSLVVPATQVASSGANTLALSAAAPPSIELFGWKIQFRGPDYHALGKCVRQNVRHYNIDIFRSIGNGRYTYVANYHIGAYRDAGRTCFVLFDNIANPKLCWKKCTPTRDDLAGMFKWILIAAAVIIGVAVIAWIIALIAEAVAAVAFAGILALA